MSTVHQAHSRGEHDDDDVDDDDVILYIRGVDGERVCSEPLHAQGALQLHLPQLPPTLLIAGPGESVCSLGAFSSRLLSESKCLDTTMIYVG